MRYPYFVALLGLTLAVSAPAAAARVPVPVKKHAAVFSAPYHELPQPKNDTHPRALAQAAPVYPKIWLGTGVSGSAIIEFIIDAKGKVREAQVVEATDEAFGDAAKAAVEKWKFQPATRGGVPMFTRSIQRLDFNPEVRRTRR